MAFGTPFCANTAPARGLAHSHLPMLPIHPPTANQQIGTLDTLTHLTSSTHGQECLQVAYFTVQTLCTWHCQVQDCQPTGTKGSVYQLFQTLHFPGATPHPVACRRAVSHCQRSCIHFRGGGHTSPFLNKQRGNRFSTIWLPTIPLESLTTELSKQPGRCQTNRHETSRVPHLKKHSLL